MNNNRPYRIILTSPAGSMKGVSGTANSNEADYIHYPLIKTEKNDLADTEKHILKHLEQYHWLIFTSKNGVRFFYEHLGELHLELPESCQTAVIGAKTADELRIHGKEADLISPGRDSDDFLALLKQKLTKRKTCALLLLGQLAPSKLQEGLKGIADTDRVDVYRTLPEQTHNEELKNLIKSGNYNIIVLTSPSAWHHLLDMLGTAVKPEAIKTAAIGPVTEKALQESGNNPLVVATQSNYETLTKEINDYLQTH